MKKSILLTLLCTTLFTGAKAQDTKEYKTCVKNDYLIHYCNHKGVTVVVDVTEGGLFVPNISIINDSGHEIIFEPKKMRSRPPFGNRTPVFFRVKHSRIVFLTPPRASWRTS